jgi:hypothetical protein
MKWTPWLFGSLTAMWVAGCGGSKQNNDTGAAASTVTDSGAIQSGAAGTATDTTGMTRTDTGMTGSMNSDTARTGSRMHNDTSATGKSGSTGGKPNQNQSGVTDTRTGKSTLGKGVTKTSPDQGQPVTSKGDTIRSGGDSVPSSNR